jgi:hypothetical protein
VVPVPWLPKSGGLSSKSLNNIANEIGVERSSEYKTKGTTATTTGSKANKTSAGSSVKQKEEEEGVKDEDEDEEEVDIEDQIDWKSHPRVWGSWEAVHPAALGSMSQRTLFPRKNHNYYDTSSQIRTDSGDGGSGEVIHPASYSLVEPLTRRQAKERAEELIMKKKEEKKRLKIEERKRKKLRAEDAKIRRAKKVHINTSLHFANMFQKSRSSSIIIIIFSLFLSFFLLYYTTTPSITIQQHKVVDDLKQLGLEEGECPLLVPTDRQVLILEETNITLEARKSRLRSKNKE